MPFLIDHTADDIVEAVIKQNGHIRDRGRAVKAIRGMLTADGSDLEKSLALFAELLGTDLGPTSRYQIAEALCDLIEEDAPEYIREEVSKVQANLRDIA